MSEFITPVSPRRIIRGGQEREDDVHVSIFHYFQPIFEPSDMWENNAKCLQYVQGVDGDLFPGNMSKNIGLGKI